MRIVNAALQSTIMVDFLRRGITDGSGSHSPHNELLRIAMEIIDGYLLCSRAYQCINQRVTMKICIMKYLTDCGGLWFKVHTFTSLVFLGLFTKLL